MILGDTVQQRMPAEKSKNDIGVFLFTFNQMFPLVLLQI